MAVGVAAGQAGGPGGPGATGNNGAKKRTAGGRRRGGKGRGGKKKKCDKKLKKKDKKSLRRASPSQEERDKAQAPPKQCPICRRSDPPGFMTSSGGLLTGAAMEAEHIVPFNKITKMNGFACLSRDDQLKVLNNPKNFAKMCKPCNSSKRDRALSYMLGKGGRDGQKYPQAGMDHIKKLQSESSNISKSLGGQIGGMSWI